MAGTSGLVFLGKAVYSHSFCFSFREYKLVSENCQGNLKKNTGGLTCDEVASHPRAVALPILLSVHATGKG